MISGKRKNLVAVTPITIIVVVLGVLGASYAYFQGSIASNGLSNVKAFANTLDNLVFNIGDDVNITANQNNFASGQGNLTGSTTSQVILAANNSNHASYNYAVSFVINENTFQYTSGTTPELTLTVTRNGTTIISNMDITTKNGIVQIPITSGSNNFTQIINASPGAITTDTWVATVTFVNLNSNQNANAGKGFKGNLVFNRGDEGTTIASSSTKLSDYKIYGNTEQLGTPSIDNPIQLRSVGDYDSSTGKYIIPITVKGKNLLDKSQSTQAGIKSESNVSLWAAVAFNNAYIKEALLPSTTYTISYDLECVSVPDYDSQYSGQAGFYLYSGVSGYTNVSLLIQQYLTAGQQVHVEKTFTTPAELHDAAANYRILVYTNRYLKNSAGVMSTMKIKNIQIEENNTATSYEPYINTTTNISLDEPLRKIGNYIDYIDYANQKVVRYTGAHTFSGTESWSVRVNNNTSYISAYMGNAPLRTISGDTLHDNSLNDEFKCNYLPYDTTQKSTTYTNRTIPTILGYGDSSAAFMITAPSSIANSAATFKTWLSTHHMELQYILASPTETSISLPDISTISGNNNISVGTSIAPSSVVFN